MRKEVLLICPDFFGPGGIARYSRILALGLIANNFSVDAYTLHDNSQLVNEQIPLANYRKCNGNKILFSFEILKRILNRQYDYIFFTHLNLISLLLFIVPIQKSTVVVSLHGIEAWHKASFFSKIFFFRISQFWAVSAYTANQFIKVNKIKANKVHVVYNCLHPNFANYQSTPIKNSNIITLLSVTRLSTADRYKGYWETLSAIKKLSSTNHNFCYVLVGDGDDYNAVQDWITTENLSKVIKLLPKLSDSDLIKTYYLSDIFILPSSGEGFGLVYLEAMACGLPVIALDSTAIPEIITHNQTGILLKSQDPSEIYHQICNLVQDISFLSQISEAGRRIVIEKFSFQNFVIQIQKQLQYFV